MHFFKETCRKANFKILFSICAVRLRLRIVFIIKCELKNYLQIRFNYRVSVKFWLILILYEEIFRKDCFIKNLMNVRARKQTIYKKGKYDGRKRKK